MRYRLIRELSQALRFKQCGSYRSNRSARGPLHDGVKAPSVEHVATIFGTRWMQSIIAIVVAFLLWRLIDAAITRFFARRFIGRFIPRVPTYASLAKSLTWVIVLFVLILTLLNIWSVNVAPALWSAGALSVVIGLGAQTMVRDILAGVFLLFDDTFDVGDGVELTTPNGVVSGVVENITLRETRIVDTRGCIISVPNGNIVFAANTTRLPSRIRLGVTVPLRSGVMALRQRIGEIADKAAQSSDVQVDHVAVRLDEVTPQTATFSVSFHVSRQHAVIAESFVREMIATTLQSEGLLPGVPTEEQH
jgi:moderate conductance mechanosensitive channel